MYSALLLMLEFVQFGGGVLVYMCVHGGLFCSFVGFGEMDIIHVSLGLGRVDSESLS